MNPISAYLEKSHDILLQIAQQEETIRKAAEWCADSILSDRIVHLFGSGHSRIMVEEMWPRYGSFPGFNPIVELSLTFHNLVVGANGQRQAMFLENTPGLAERILRNFAIRPQDTAVILSSSGCSVVAVEMAALFKEQGVKVIGVISKKHSETSKSRHIDGKKLQDFADLVLDTGAPVGDAMIRLPGLETPVAPGSSLGGILLMNSIKAEIANILVRSGRPLLVLTAASLLGSKAATALFEKAYDQHGRLLSKILSHPNSDI